MASTSFASEVVTGSVFAGRPFDFLCLCQKNHAKSNNATTARVAPTAIPAVAPVDSPEEVEAEDDTAVLVMVELVEFPDGVNVEMEAFVVRRTVLV